MIRVRIPATTANLGPGFDSMGLALNLWNTFELRLEGEPGTVSVRTEGEGANTLPQDQSHLVARTLIEETWPGLMPRDRGIQIFCQNNVPAASGLGSSSTAVLAGLLFSSALSARAMHPEAPESVLESVRAPENVQRVLTRAIKLEGHGDNVAPALLGGLILVVSGGEPVVRTVEHAPIRVVVCVPEFNFLTADARAALPAQYPRADTIFNIGHSLLVLEALRCGDAALLRRAMGDRVHEPYRMPLIPGATEVRTHALEAGAFACTLSGAGPGLIAFAESNHEAIGAAMVQGFAGAGLRARSWVLDAIHEGTSIEATK